MRGKRARHIRKKHGVQHARLAQHENGVRLTHKEKRAMHLTPLEEAEEGLVELIAEGDFK